MSSKSSMNAQTVFGLHKNAIAYSFTSLASSMMNSVYGFYYVNVFLNRYHIQESWFQIAQILFLIWNAVNDPLFAYFQDKNRTRQSAISGGALIWAIAFLIFWFPWTSDGAQHPIIVGCHFIVALFLYDAMLTYVLLAQCAIFAEISKEHDDKVRLIKYSQIAGLIGACSVMICNMLSQNLKNYGVFQFCCVIIAVLAYIFMQYSGKNTLIEADMNAESAPELEGDKYNYMSLTLQIMKNRNFMSFVLVNLFTIFSYTFTSNFTAIICNHIITEAEMSSFTRSIFYGSMFLMPQVVIIFGSSFIARVGYYRIIKWSFVWKVFLAIIMYIIGPSFHWLLLIFFILDNTNSNAMFSLYNLPLSDIVEEDLINNRRSVPVSSMVFGTNALITKPAHSFAPMFAVWILNMYGYGRLQAGEKLTPVELDSLFHAMFNMACFIPIVIGALQFVTWSFYRLRNTHTYTSKYVEA